MRTVELGPLRGGIDRLRTRSNADPRMLYDLLNGHLTSDGTAVCRPGTARVATLPATTKGLIYFDGAFHTFSNASVVVPSGYALHVIPHPDDDTLEITKIHFAKPFLGFLYVVAEFTDEAVYHYWLRLSGTWAANTVYFAGDIVEPTAPNGIAYEATRIGAPNLSWSPDAPRAVSDVIEPTVYNGYYYTAVDTLGSSPRSGTTEPEWPTEEGAQVSEDADGLVGASTAVTEEPTNQTPQSVQERYG